MIVTAVNIDYTYINYNSIQPYSFNSISSESGSFNLEFDTDEQYNVLFYEMDQSDMQIELDNNSIVSDVLVIKGDISILPGSIALQYNLDNLQNDSFKSYDKISFARYNNGEIEKITTDLDYTSNTLNVNINNFGSYFLVYNENNTFTEIPQSTSIVSCYPNPFNPYTTITYILEESSDVDFSIYNINGQKIYGDIFEKMNEGINEFIWEGKNNFGSQLPSGIYIIKIITNNKTLTQKVTLLK